MKCIVTGGAGFIGSHLCHDLVERNHEVLCIDNFIAGNTVKCKFAKVDVTDYYRLHSHFKNADFVFHQAASKCTVCLDSPYIDLLTNAWGTYNVCRAVHEHNVRKLIHASTGSIADIKSFYGVSKQAGESYLKAFVSYYPNFKYTALRYHHIYGPNQNTKGGVVAIFIKQVLNNQPCTIFGDGLQVRHFTHVKDAIAANLFAAAEPWTDNKVLNVISRTTMTIIDLAKLIHKILGKKYNAIHLPPKPGEIRTFKATGIELESMGFEFDNDFEKGLRETIKWYTTANASM